MFTSTDNIALLCHMLVTMAGGHYYAPRVLLRVAAGKAKFKHVCRAIASTNVTFAVLPPLLASHLSLLPACC